ncbi:MAG: thymidine phosphorylase [Anaerolineae bacterium]
MNAVDIIIKKRDGQALSKEEIGYFVHGFVTGDIADYQAAAWAMAVLWRGMSREETRNLTLSMAYSGETLDLHDVAPIVADKHSTGGVGDKTTIAVAPMVSACGLPVGKMSGRGLGFSGGTLDKLEAIPGFRVDLSVEEFRAQLAEIGLVVSGQTKRLAPADGKLYALRDVTGTVPSLPLIASSIMSKKIAAGADVIVLDVKTGRGAFMETLEKARALAHAMVDIGQGLGRQVAAVISDMNQPLGHAVGNALETAEAVMTLRGKGPDDFWRHCLAIAEQMLVLGGRARDRAAARSMLHEVVQSGRALRKLVEWVEAQGGDASELGDPPGMAVASIVKDVVAPRSGQVAAIDAREVGLAAVDLGAGRRRKGDPIDHAVGIVLQAKVGDRVAAGDRLFTVHANDRERCNRAQERVLQAYGWAEEGAEPPPLIYEVID